MSKVLGFNDEVSSTPATFIKETSPILPFYQEFEDFIFPQNDVNKGSQVTHLYQHSDIDSQNLKLALESFLHEHLFENNTPELRQKLSEYLAKTMGEIMSFQISDDLIVTYEPKLLSKVYYTFEPSTDYSDGSYFDPSI